MDQTATEDLETWLQGLKEEAAPFINQEEEEKVVVVRQQPTNNDKESPLQAYLQTSLLNSQLPDPSLLVLSGFSYEEEGQRLTYSLLPEYYQKSVGGFFVKAFGKGFAINPGTHFLERLHQKGITVQDIDFVIVTSGNPEDFSEAVSLYELNYKCNVMQEKLHLIRYYLHKEAYKALFGILQPRFKQEKDTVAALELFEDSPQVESITLSDHVTLHYAADLSILLEIKKAYSIAWLAKESILLEKGLTADIIFLQDEEISLPPLSQKPLLFTFGKENEEGDRRLERALKQRQALEIETLFPFDQGLLVHLEDLSIQCAVCNQAAPIEDVHVVKSKKSFGKLLYLCSECCL